MRNPDTAIRAMRDPEDGWGLHVTFKDGRQKTPSPQSIPSDDDPDVTPGLKRTNPSAENKDGWYEEETVDHCRPKIRRQRNSSRGR